MKHKNQTAYAELVWPAGSSFMPAPDKASNRVQQVHW